jgi:hypothetical protein
LFDLEDRDWHQLEPGTYQTSWFGIPWFYLSETHHYKIISIFSHKPDGIEKGVRFYTSTINGQDQICYVDPDGTTFARTNVVNGSDTNCKLIIDPSGGFCIEPINTGDPDPSTVLKEGGKFVAATAKVIIEATATVLAG